MDRFTRGLKQLSNRIIGCRQCPRLVAYREQVAREKRRQYQDWHYWGRPLPGFGDPRGKLLIIGLAPAAHGGNRTGRMFTGNRSGEWLFRTLHRSGFANQPQSTHREDGLALRNCFITAVIRCVPPKNKPLREEMKNCRPYLVQEIILLKEIQVIIALGRIAFHGFLEILFAEGKPPQAMKFGHSHEYLLPDGKILLASYHPSQQNTQTGRLTQPMFESIFQRTRERLNFTC
jgi:uracil-DNA glycosylase family 4